LYEQKRDAGGNITFIQQIIMDDFSTKNAGGVFQNRTAQPSLT
jgi:hypothetical protein